MHIIFYIYIYLYADNLGDHDQCFLLDYAFFWRNVCCQQPNNDHVLVL